MDAVLPAGTEEDGGEQSVGQAEGGVGVMDGSMTVGRPPIGFLTLEKTEGTESDQGFVAAWMVVDGHGYPLEFRATTPVKPSTAQRTLYGSSLENYIAVELCGRILVRESKRKPTFILVPHEALLELADETDAHVMAVWRPQDSTPKDREGDQHGHGSVRCGGGELVFSAARINREDEAQALGELEACVRAFDPAEAFSRMHAAVDLLRREDPRYA